MTSYNRLFINKRVLGRLKVAKVDYSRWNDVNIIFLASLLIYMDRPKTQTRRWIKLFGQSAPKICFAHKNVLEMGVHSAILQYNGVLAVSNVLDCFRVSLGCVTNHISIMDDRGLLRKSSEGGKKRRKKLRSKLTNVLNEEKETGPQESYLKGSY